MTAPAALAAKSTLYQISAPSEPMVVRVLRHLGLERGAHEERRRAGQHDHP